MWYDIILGIYIYCDFYLQLVWYITSNFGRFFSKFMWKMETLFWAYVYWTHKFSRYNRNLSQHSSGCVAAYLNRLVQERRNSIANALELRLSCTNPSKYILSESNIYFKMK